jgi:hypothetical protein
MENQTMVAALITLGIVGTGLLLVADRASRRSKAKVEKKPETEGLNVLICPKCGEEMVIGSILNQRINFQEGTNIKFWGLTPSLVKRHSVRKGIPAKICRKCKLCLFHYNQDV